MLTVDTEVYTSIKSSGPSPDEINLLIQKNDEWGRPTRNFRKCTR